MNPYIKMLMSGQGSNVNKTDDTGTTIFDSKGNQALKILGIDENGNVIAKRYKLLDLNDVDQLKPPELQSIDGADGQPIHLNQLTQELIGPSMFHLLDGNTHTIEQALNIVLKDLAIVADNQNKLNDYFKALNSDNLDGLTNSISKAIGDDIDSKVAEQNSGLVDRLERIENMLQEKGSSIGVFPPSYTGSTGTGEIDNDDSIIENKLNKMDKELGD